MLKYSYALSPVCNLFVFFQNSYIGYEVLQKLAIPQPKQYLEVMEAVNVPLLFKSSVCLY